MDFRPDMAPAGPTTAAAADTASQLAGSLCSFLSTPAVTTGHNTTLLGTPVLSPAAAANPMPASSLLLHALQQGPVPGSANLPQTSPIGQTSAAAAARLATSLSPAAAAGTLLSPASIPLGAPQTLMMPGTYSVPTPSLATLTQAQLLQLQAQAALAQYTAATTTAAPSTSLLAPAPPSGPLPSISATTQTSTTSSAGGKVMRKVLLSYGGVSSTTSAGGWEYVGGETRLLGGLDSTSCSYDDLASRVEAEVQLKLGVDVVLRYELPGCPGTLVDVKCDTDVANMWSEWSDFCSLSKQPTFKLHLYVDRPPVISTSANSSRSAGRSSDTPLSGAGEAVGGGESVPPSSLTTETLPTASTAPSPFAPKDASPLAGSLSGGSQHQAPGSSAEALTALPAGTVAATAAPVTPAAAAPPAAAPSVAGPPAAPRPAGERGLLGAAAATAARERLGMLAGPTPTSSATPSLASFDRLVSRVKSTVEMIRPADLRIIRFMGSGGFADCYLAKWLGVEVAVKCLRDMPGAHTSSRAAVKELLREASILSGMRHPNVLCLYAVALPDQLAVDYGLKPPPPSPPAPIPHSPPPAPSSGSGHPLPSSSRGSHPALTTVVESQETDGPAADEEPAGVSTTAATTSPTGDAPSAQPEWAATPAGLGRLRTPSSEKASNGLVPAPAVGMPAWPEPPSSGRAAAAPTSASNDEEEAQDARSKTATRAAQQLSPPTSPFAAAASEASPEGAFGSVALLSPPADTAASASSMPATAPPSSSPATTEPQVSPQRSAAFTSTNTTVTANISFGLGSPAPTMSLGTNSAASGPSDIVEPEPAVAPRPEPPLHQGSIPSYLYSTEDDETIRKSVLAAEAAAAASADVESQTAVSEGLITRPALVAEFLSGCSLGSAITRKADFLNSDLVLTKVAMDAARGMEYCHGKKITHWNLKPGNLIVGFSSDKVPLCKVADIGLLRPRQLAELDDAGVARVLPWAAPELVRAPHTATDKVDVYSFGMCMWSMWARKHPYTTVDIAHVFLRTMQGHVVRPPLPGSPDWEAMYPGDAPPPEPAPGWSDLMQRCWAPQAAARPPFSEVAAALISMFNAAKSAKRATRAAAAKARHGDARAAAAAHAAS